MTLKELDRKNAVLDEMYSDLLSYADLESCERRERERREQIEGLYSGVFCGAFYIGFLVLIIIAFSFCT